jgi:hypothetical protein
MPRIRPTVSRVLTVAMLMTSAFADTVTLKNGEHLEGKITAESDKEVTMEVQVSAGITDQRVLQKAEIEKIDKVSPELLAYQELANVQLGANSLLPTQYDPYISALQAFAAQYPSSSRAGDVQTTLKAFQEEKKRVEGGEVKIDNQWLTKAEAEKESVQIHGRLGFTYMKAQSAAGDYIGALNTFATVEKSYGGASIMPDAVELAYQLVQRLKTTVDQAIPNQKETKAQQDRDLAAAGPAQRAEMTAAIKKESDAADAAVQAAQTANRWPPFDRKHEKSLLALQTRAAAELTRLAAVPVAKMRESLQFTEAAKQSLAAGDVTAASDSVKQATQLWSANESAIRLGKEIEAQKAQKAAAVTPVPATPKPTPKPATPHPVAVQATQAVSAAPADAEEDKPFIMTLPGAISVVVGIAAVLAGVNAFLKIKKRKAEQAENS